MTPSELYRIEHPKLIGALRRRYRLGQQDAEDVAQLVWVHLLKYPPPNLTSGIVWFTLPRVHGAWGRKKLRDAERDDQWKDIGWRDGPMKRPTKGCEVAGCHERVYAREVCCNHYRGRYGRSDRRAA